jgi:hypothetical protein
VGFVADVDKPVSALELFLEVLIPLVGEKCFFDLGDNFRV